MNRYLLLLLLFHSFLFARDGGLETKGSFYSDLSLLHYANSDTNDSLSFSGMSTLNLNIRNRNRSQAKVDGSLEIKMPYGSFESTSMPGENEEVEIPIMSDYVLASLDGSYLLLDLRRLYAALYFDRVELSFGRQNIDFGEGMIYSPIDLFSTVDVSDFRYRKSGADVVNMEVSLTDLAGFSGTVELPYGSREHSSALKLFTTLGSFDIAGVGIYKHKAENGIGGVTFKGDAYIGVYGEALCHIPNKNEETSFDGMIGLDYSVASKWFFVGEYQYTGLNDHHSMFLATNYTFNELLSGGASVIHSISDESSLATAQITYNVLQNADLTLFVRGYNNHPFGEDLPSYDIDYSLRAVIKF